MNTQLRAVTTETQSDTAREFYKVVESRRSVRSYTEEAVPPEVVARCIDAARLAPSSNGLQHWEFYLIASPEMRAKFNEVCLKQSCVQTAPLLIAVVAHWGTWRRHRAFLMAERARQGTASKTSPYYVPLVYRQGPLNMLKPVKHLLGAVIGLFRPFPMLPDARIVAHKNTALAASTLMLAFRAEGYDTCPMEGFEQAKAKKLLSLGRKAEVCMMMAVGRRAIDGIQSERMIVPREWVVKEI